jgi:hypothetical protein
LADGLLFEIVSSLGYFCLNRRAAMAEAHACQEALHAVASWGMINVQIEADAQNLPKGIQDNSFDRTTEGVIYRDIRSFIRLNFSSLSFSYCPRNCNNLAHNLAAVGVRRQEVWSLWLESLPDDVICLMTSMSADSFA